MTLAQAVTQFGQKATLEQSVFSGTDSGTAWSVSNDNATSLINEAMRRISLRAGLRDPKIAFTLTTAQQEYRLNLSTVVGANVTRPMKVVIDGTPLLDASGKNYGLWTLDEFEAVLPKWRTNTATGKPYIACYTGHSLGSGSNAGGASVLLYPAPSSTYSALATHYIDGYCSPHAMTYSGDSAKELKLPIELHDFIVDLAVIIGENPNASEAEHWNRLDRVMGGVESATKWFRNEEARASAPWGSIGNMYQADEVSF